VPTPWPSTNRRPDAQVVDLQPIGADTAATLLITADIPQLSGMSRNSQPLFREPSPATTFPWVEQALSSLGQAC
ncbi:MAG: hypothetical protein OXS33_06585, partial [bacterium]|nr:hypothetical protein [bacterium]